MLVVIQKPTVVDTIFGCSGGVNQTFCNDIILQCIVPYNDEKKP